MATAAEPAPAPEPAAEQQQQQQPATAVVRTQLLEDLMQSNVELVRHILTQTQQAQQAQQQQQQAASPPAPKERIVITLPCPHCDGSGVVLSSAGDSESVSDDAAAAQAAGAAHAGMAGCVVDILQILMLVALLIWLVAPFGRGGSCPFRGF
jgi:hypothetical protein